MDGCQQSLDWTTGLDYWTDQFYILGLKTLHINFYPARTCAARGKVISRGMVVGGGGVHKKSTVFLEPIFQNTHFQSSFSAQIGFLSNLMASDTAQKLDKSSWPSQNPIVCHFG